MRYLHNFRLLIVSKEHYVNILKLKSIFWYYTNKFYLPLKYKRNKIKKVVISLVFLFFVYKNTIFFGYGRFSLYLWIITDVLFYRFDILTLDVTTRRYNFILICPQQVYSTISFYFITFPPIHKIVTYLSWINCDDYSQS